MFSSRLNWNAPPNPLSQLLAEKRRRYRPVLDLTESNPTHAGIQYPAEGIAQALADARVLRYEPEAFGLRRAREAVAQYYSAAGFEVSPSRIVLTASTSEAYSYLFKLLADPGDEILTPRPSYPLFEYLAQLESVKTVQYPLFYDHGWHLDTAAFHSLITPRTRAIVIVNPNNPTGNFLKRHEFDEMLQAAQRHSLTIISDEVFSDYALSEDAARVTFAAHNPGALTFSLSGVSKVVGLPQMKLGWMVTGGPERLQKQALEGLELIADTYLSVGTPVQLAGPALLDARISVQAQIRDRVALNLRHLQAAPGLRVLQVEGGWYAILHMPRTRSEEEWAMGLLRDHDVLVQPGFFYDFDSEAYLVVSLLTPPAIFTEGIQRLCREL